ncbi:trehalase family glycosidase [Novosphingobium profundi]|uniref:trehalase family glycosidase n=1 Tax=Novosphingobium profundi TaxID=1774954 RepID=UPI0031B9EE1C
MRAGAESGWDFSSRWLGDGRTLATIETTRIVPIDLNSLLWNLENTIARRCQELADKACHDDFRTRATHRKAAIMRYLWSRDEQRFVDWNRDRQAPSESLSAAMLYPLFVGLASPNQAEATAKLAEARLLAPGGLRTTSVATGQQWDEPNGWAPLVWIAVQGLDRYGRSDLADRIAGRWIATVSAFYACTGRMVEKYDVDQGLAGGGGEYPVQDGFGWTNGVSRVLLDRPGTKDALVARCPPRARVAAPDGQR